MIFFVRMLATILVVGVLASPVPPPAIEIKLAHGSPEEARTKDQLNRLLQQYPLTPWYFTKSIAIDEKAIPHSHPTLTLHTRHLKDDDLMLSTFVHEQIHWFLENRGDETKAAENDLRGLFSESAGGFPGWRAGRGVQLSPPPGEFSGMAFG